MTLKIRPPFSQKVLSVPPKWAIPFLKKANAFFQSLHFSPVPWWLRPIPVWTIKIKN